VPLVIWQPFEVIVPAEVRVPVSVGEADNTILPVPVAAVTFAEGKLCERYGKKYWRGRVLVPKLVSG
jgi:hypothetical protein